MQALGILSTLTFFHFFNSRHLTNFVLLFLSNVENLVAYLMRNVMNDTFIYYAEVLLGVVYLYLVVKNLTWFISPLKERDEYIALVIWYTGIARKYRRKCDLLVGKLLGWRKPAEGNAGISVNATAIKAAIRMKEKLRKSNIIDEHENSDGDDLRFISRLSGGDAPVSKSSRFLIKRLSGEMGEDSTVFLTKQPSREIEKDGDAKKMGKPKGNSVTFSTARPKGVSEVRFE